MTNRITILTAPDNPLACMGSLHSTRAQAQRACALEWLTAGGHNDDEFVAQSLRDNTNAELLAEMASEGWRWPAETDANDALDALDALREEILGS